MNAFKPPGESERRQAAGPTGDLPQPLQRAFDPGPHFEPLEPPKPGDWLDAHPEPGQTYAKFLRGRWNRPNPPRDKIYLQPLDEFPPHTAPDLQTLSEYVSAFFRLEAVVLPPRPLEAGRITSRLNPYTGNRQLLTGDVLSALRQALPADAFCILAISMVDLYPDPAWNFVFGQASLRERVGVYSFARYDPAFFGHRRGPDTNRLLLMRSCKVLAHETAHMFGLAHCVYYRCLLNGSNHIQESDARPMHLCPVDLRKLHTSVRFDLIDRYRRLADFYRSAGFTQQAGWVERRLAWIEPERPAS